jgi:DNA-binding FadR family transcriptional regulator
MIFKSFEPVCKNLIRMYFESEEFRLQSILQHKQLYQSILEKKSTDAQKIMKSILLRGKAELTKLNTYSSPHPSST